MNVELVADRRCMPIGSHFGSSRAARAFQRWQPQLLVSRGFCPSPAPRVQQKDDEDWDRLAADWGIHDEAKKVLKEKFPIRDFAAMTDTEMLSLINMIPLAAANVAADEILQQRSRLRRLRIALADQYQAEAAARTLRADLELEEPLPPAQLSDLHEAFYARYRVYYVPEECPSPATLSRTSQGVPESPAECASAVQDPHAGRDRQGEGHQVS